MKRSLIVGFLFFSVLVIITNSRQAESGEREGLSGRYFAVFWAYQGEGNRPRDAHTFATFYDGADLDSGRVRPATISWLPVSGSVHLLGSESGRNFSLKQTLGLACQSGKQVRSWGPYEISPGIYRRALARIRLLESGKVVFSALHFQPGTMNCVVAAGSFADGDFHPGPTWGFRATEALVHHLSSSFLRGVGHQVSYLINAQGCGGYLQRQFASH